MAIVSSSFDRYCCTRSALRHPSRISLHAIPYDDPSPQDMTHICAFFSSLICAPLPCALPASLCATIALKLLPPPINVSSSTSTMPPPSLPSLTSRLTAFPSARFSSTLSLPVAWPSRSSSRPARRSRRRSASRPARSSSRRCCAPSRAFWTSAVRLGTGGPSVGPATGREEEAEEEEGPSRAERRPVSSMCLRTEAASSSSRWVADLKDQTWEVLVEEAIEEGGMPE